MVGTGAQSSFNLNVLIHSTWVSQWQREFVQLKYPLIHKYYLIQWEKKVLLSFLSVATGISGESTK